MATRWARQTGVTFCAVASIFCLVSPAVAQNTLSVSQTSLSFSGRVKASGPPQQQFQVSTTSSGVSYSVAAATSSGGNWLSAFPNSNSTPATVSVFADPSSITVAGTYNGTITVTAAGTIGSPIVIPVTFTVTSNTLSVSQSSLSFSGQVKATGPPQQQFQVSTTASGVSYSLAVATSSGGNWLSAFPNSNSTPATVSVFADPSSITVAGTYSGTITVTAAGTIGSPIVIPVTFTVTSNTLSVSQSSLSFSGQVKANGPPQQQFQVSTTASGVSYTLSVATSSGGNWLSAFPNSNSTPATVSVFADPSSITVAGTYNGTITVTAAGTIGSPIVIPVTFTVTSNTLSVSQSSLSFSGQVKASGPPQQQFQVSTTASGVSYTLSVATSSGGNWLSAFPNSNSTPATVSVFADPSSITAAGTYSGTITVTAAGTIGSPIVIPVTFTVTSNMLSVSQNSLSFSGQVKANGPPQQQFQVSTTASGVSYTLSVATTSGGNWLSAFPNSNSTPATVSVFADPSSITAAGTYNGTITVTAAGTIGSPIVIPVTFTVTSNTVSVSQSSLSFSGQVKASGPPQQQFQVSTTASGVSYTLSVATSSGGNWLSAFPNSNSTPATVSVFADPSSITAAGTYNGTITVTAAGTIGSPIVIPVTFTVTSNTLSVSQSSLSFSGQVKASGPPQQQFQVSTTASGVPYTLSVATTSGGNWLSAFPNSNSTPATVSVFADPSSITAAGTYSGSITVTAAGTIGSPIVIPVTFTVTGNTLSVSPTSLSFTTPVGGSSPSAQYLTITSSGSGLSYTAAVTAGASWLTVTNPSGTTPANPNGSPAVSVNPAGLAQGTYSGSITVTATGAGNSPVNIPVTLTVGNNLLTVLPISLSFSYQVGASAPAAQYLTLTSTGSGLNYTASVTSGASWLQVSNPGGTTPASPNAGPAVAVVPTGLAIGTYSGAITITATGAGNNPVTIPVTLTVGSNLLTVSPTSLNFSYQPGGTVPVAQALTVTSTANGLNYTASVTAGGSWLQLSGPSGTTPSSTNANPSVTVVPTGLTPGTYSGTITVTAAGAANSPVAVPVTLVVGNNLLTVTPTALSFTYQAGGTAPPAQYLTIASTSNGLNYTASVTGGASWLQVSNPSGATPANPTGSPAVSVVPAGLAAGTYTGTIAVTATGAANSPVTVAVTLTVGTNLLTIAPGSLSFSYQLGTNAPAAQNLAIASTGSGLSYTAAVTAGANWLQVTNAAGTTPATSGSGPVVSVVPAGLAAGTYNGTITVTATGAGNSPVILPVTLVVGNNPLSVTPTSLSFSFALGASAPPAQCLTFATTSPGLAYTSAVTTGSAWLQVSNGNGTTPSNVCAQVNAAGLAVGSYNGVITVTAAGASNSPITIAVTLAVTNNGLTVSPTSLTFSSLPGGSAPPAQYLSISSTSDGLAYTATVAPGAAWLQVSNSSGTTPATSNTGPAVSVNPGGLTAGTYNGTIAVTAAGAGNSPISVSVTLVIGATPLTVSPTSLSFSYYSGGTAPPAQYLTLASAPSGLNFTASVTAGASWLVVGNATGATPATGNAGPAVSVNTAGLAAGSYSGTITVSAAGASNSPVLIPVTLTVTANQLTVSPAALSFNFALGGTAPPPQYLTLASPGAGLSFTASVTSGASWLQVSNPTGTTPANPNTSPAVSINTAGLAPGTYNGAVTITAAGAANSPVTVPVTLTVSNNLLNVLQTALNFNYQLGGSAPPAQLLTIGSTVSGLAFTATVGAGASWLQVNNASGTTPTNSSTSPSVSIVPTGLVRGTYSGAINISASGAANSPVTITVTLVVGNNLLTISPTALNFSFQPGGTVPPAQSLAIASTSPGLNYSTSVAAGASWLQVSNPSGITPATSNTGPAVSVVPTGLAAGTYNGAIIITATGADNSPVTIPVTLVVGPPGNPLSITPSSLSFSFVTSAAQAPPQQCLTVIGTPPGLAYTVSLSTPASWLKVSIGTGTTPSNVCVQVDPAGLAKGSYSGTIAITAAGAGNNPIRILVQFTVSDPTISCTVPTLSAGIAGTAFQAGLSCSGGLAPYKSWQLASQPAGMAIDASGKLTWPSPSCGVWNFTFSATDAGNQPSAQTSAQLVIKPVSATVNNFPSTIQPVVNVNGITVTLSSVCNQDITGTLALKFTPASGVTATSSGTADGAVAFSTAGLSVSVRIPSGSTTANFNNSSSTVAVGVQTGTVAGAFQLTPLLSGTVAPATINGNLAGTDTVKDPVVTGITATRSGSTLTVTISGYSSTRDLKQATFTFDGSGIQGGSVIAPLSSASGTWFQNQSSAATGGQFVYTQTFGVTGPASQVTSVSVALTNSASSGTGGTAGPANFTGS